MKKSLTYHMKKTGTRLSAAIEIAETSLVLAAFKAISSCTSFVLDRAYQTSQRRHNNL